MRQPNFVLIGLALALVTGMVVLADVLGHRLPQADATILLSDIPVPNEDSASRSDPSRVRFAVASVLSPRATLEHYGALATYLSARLGRPVELVQSKTYAETNALVRSGDVSVALVCSGAFVMGRREFGMEALAVPVVDGKVTYQSYLIVPSNSNVRTWKDLRQKTFAFTDPLSNSGRLVPVYMLTKMGETPDSFFKNFIFTYSHDKSIHAVAEGLVEAAAVDSLVYNAIVQQEPSIAKKTRIVWESPLYGINPVVVNPGAPPELREELKAILLNMAGDADGREILERLGIDAFVTPDPSAYDSIEAMLRDTKGQ